MVDIVTDIIVVGRRALRFDIGIGICIAFASVFVSARIAARGGTYSVVTPVSYGAPDGGTWRRSTVCVLAVDTRGRLEVKIVRRRLAQSSFGVLMSDRR